MPTPEINNKLKQLQNLYISYYNNNNPTIQIINSFKNDLILDIKIQLKKEWKSVVRLASENFSNAPKFWHEINRLRDSNSKKNTYTSRSSQH